MKPNNKEQEDFNYEDDDDVEVQSSGPSIGINKKSKIAIIALISVFATFIIYLFFFSGDKQEIKENLKIVEAAPLPSQAITPGNSGESLFDINSQNELLENQDKLKFAENEDPDTPALPELSEEELKKRNFIIPDDIEDEDKKIDTIVKQQPLPALGQQIGVQQKPVEINPKLVNASQDQAGRLQLTEDQIKILEEEAKRELNPRYSPIVVFSGGGAVPTRGVGYDNNIVNLNEDPISKLEETESAITATYLADRANTIAQGKLMNAVLETAINTESPGLVRAIVSRDVYGESGNDVLIPRGSRLYGSYTSEIQRGQGRVQIAWNRLIRPDGVDLSVSFNASDQFGRAGIEGELDSKYSSLIANSILTSALAVGGIAAVQQAFGDDNLVNTTTVNPSQGATTISTDPTSQALYDVSRTVLNTVNQIVTNAINVNPIIRISQGTRITVIVNADIKIPNIKNITR